MKRVAQGIRDGVVFVYNKTHWFSDHEAWAVFRFFAFLEGAGWTILIIGIIYKNLGLPEGDSVVYFGGMLHGMIMASYYIFTLLTARSMEWGFWRVVVALVAGIPPYGTVIFEQYMAWRRRKNPPRVTPPPSNEVG